MKAQTGTRRRGGSDAQRSRSKKREREIIDTAAEIFHRQGYADTSVQDVADAVGILKGSLYYYIDSKEDLLFQVLVEVHEDAQGIIDDVGGMDATPLEKLYEYVRRHIDYNTRNLSKIAVYYHDFGLLGPDRRKEIVKQRAMYEDFVVSVIQEAQERGEVDDTLDARLVANAVFGTMNWIYTWYRPGGRAGPEYLGQLYAELVVNGITGATMPAALPARKRRAAKGSRASR
jgi:AcrR family transcriptional regulator